jgi:hypothetical protein
MSIISRAFQLGVPIPMEKPGTSILPQNHQPTAKTNLNQNKKTET